MQAPNMGGTARSARIEVTQAFQYGLIIFTLTALLGLANATQLFGALDRNTLLTHLHSGTLGWITMGVIGIAIWIFAREREDLVAPVMLIATVVLSFASALGVSALFFNNVFNFGGADTSFPLFVFVFLVALGIDYNIFLMTRVREEAQRQGARHGAVTGLAATGGVITSAGAVLAGTFAVLGTLPVTFLTELGFAVALGVLLDTIVVRSVLVTALNLDLGRWVWWPSRLARQPSPEAEIVGDEPAAVP